MSIYRNKIHIRHQQWHSRGPGFLISPRWFRKAPVKTEAPKHCQEWGGHSPLLLRRQPEITRVIIYVERWPFILTLPWLVAPRNSSLCSSLRLRILHKLRSFSSSWSLIFCEVFISEHIVNASAFFPVICLLLVSESRGELSTALQYQALPQAQVTCCHGTAQPLHF